MQPVRWAMGRSRNTDSKNWEDVFHLRTNSKKLCEFLGASSVVI